MAKIIDPVYAVLSSFVQESKLSYSHSSNSAVREAKASKLESSKPVTEGGQYLCKR